MAQSNDDRSFFGTEPLGRLMARLALPSIASQLVTMLYVVIDRIFVGNIPEYGVDALAALGVVIPVSVVAQAFGLYIAAGATPLAGMKLGEGDKEGVHRTIGNAATLLIIAMIVLVIALIPVTMYALPWFGASQNTLPYAQIYLFIWIIGVPFMLLSNATSMTLLAQGDSSRVLIVNVGTSVLNVLLNALFIFVFGWGVAGAAIATVIAQALCGIILLVLLQAKTSPFRICKGYFGLRAAYVKRILSIGLGRLLITVSEGVLIIILNAQMQLYGGDAYVAALTILETMQMAIFNVTNGFTQGTQGVVSYCYGAQLEERTKSAMRYFVLSTTAICFLVTGSCIVFSEAIGRVFTSDAQTVQLIVDYTPLFLCGLLPMGIQVGFQTLFMTVGKGFRSMMGTFFRKILLFIPLAIILPPIYGTWGVWIAEPISDFCGIVFVSILFACSFRTVMRDMYKEKV